MARNVYYDPFGMRTEGYRAGVGDEMQLQDQTRRARMSDWDFANVKPLELEGLQREEAFQGYFDPYRRTAARGGVYDQQVGRAAQFGMATGIDAPLRNTMFNYFPADRTYQEYDPNTQAPVGDPRYYYQNQTGGLEGYGLTDRSMLDYFMFERNLQMAEQERAAAALGLNRDQMVEGRYQFDQTLPIQRANAETQRQYMLRSLNGGAAGAGYFDGFGE